MSKTIWKIHVDNNSPRTISIVEIDTTNPTKEHIVAHVYSGGMDAQLITAAPNLRESLSNLLTTIKKHDYPVPGYWINLIAECDKALDKANGK